MIEKIINNKRIKNNNKYILIENKKYKDVYVF